MLKTIFDEILKKWDNLSTAPIIERKPVRVMRMAENKFDEEEIKVREYDYTKLRRVKTDDEQNDTIPMCKMRLYYMKEHIRITDERGHAHDKTYQFYTKQVVYLENRIKQLMKENMGTFRGEGRKDRNFFL